jgi:hypothetical protein
MVISLRSAAGIATIWVLAIGGVSATAWVAIDRAGRDITNADVSSLALPPLSTPSAPGPTVTEQTPADTEPPARSVAAPPPPSRTPSPTAGSRAPRRGPAPATPPAPASQVRTASVRGGQVTVRCVGARIQLQVAQPENDWRVQVEDTEPRRVVVSFTEGDEEESHRTRVTAACNQGAPEFDVKTD